MRGRGEKNSRSKLREVDVVEIRRRYFQTDATMKQLAEEYDVTEAAISQAVNRKTWAHVP